MIPTTKREAARGLLTALFRERPRILIAEVMKAAEERDISRRTMTRACRDLGVTEIHNGRNGAIWAWPSEKDHTADSLLFHGKKKRKKNDPERERGYTVVSKWRPNLQTIRLGDIVLSESDPATEAVATEAAREED